MVIANINDEEKEEDNLSIKDKYNFESSKESIDLNEDFEINSLFNDIESESNLSLQSKKSFLSTIMSFVNNSKDSFESIYNNINNVTIDELIKYVIKKHDEGITFDQIKHIIEQQILQLSQNIDNLLNWLKKNQNRQQYVWFLGLFYYHNIIIY